MPQALYFGAWEIATNGVQAFEEWVTFSPDGNYTKFYFTIRPGDSEGIEVVLPSGRDAAVACH